MKADIRSGQFDCAAPFNYAPKEWQAIAQAVSEGCPRPMRWDFLLVVANEYVEYRPEYLPPAKLAAACRRRAAATAAFREIVTTAESSVHSMWRRLATKNDRAKLLDLLDGFRRIAEFEAEVLKTGESNGPGTAERAFFDGIFGLWVQSGGGLRRSRNRMQLPDGPLIRYVRAAAGPVMGRSTPAPESIYRMVRDQQEAYRGAGYVIDSDHYVVKGPRRTKLDAALDAGELRHRTREAASLRRRVLDHRLLVFDADGGLVFGDRGQ